MTGKEAELLVVAILNPNSSTETITTYGEMEVRHKAINYMDLYDENFCAKDNPDRQVVGFILL